MPVVFGADSGSCHLTCGLRRAPPVGFLGYPSAPARCSRPGDVTREIADA